MTISLYKNKMSKVLLVETTCTGCPFSHTEVDFDAVGSEYFHTCNLARFLNLPEYCTGVSDADEDYTEGEKEDIEWCPLKVEKEITIKFIRK